MAKRRTVGDQVSLWWKQNLNPQILLAPDTSSLMHETVEVCKTIDALLLVGEYEGEEGWPETRDELREIVKRQIDIWWFS